MQEEDKLDDSIVRSYQWIDSLKDTVDKEAERKLQFGEYQHCQIQANLGAIRG